jgi:hypothetical protein
MAVHQSWRYCDEINHHRRTRPLAGDGVSAGAVGAFERPPGTPPVPILIGAVGPLVVFLAGYWGSPRFRAFVLAIDLPLATAIQAWRAGGLGFLALYAHGVLPGVFAWPAGLGDIAIGVTAP